MSAPAPARTAAHRALLEAARRGGYVRDLLTASEPPHALDARDRGLAMRLALGVTATSGCLDEALDAFLAKPNKVSPRVRCALRIAAFELLYGGTAPEVAVSQGVELVRASARGAAGLANAVLRRVSEAREGYLSAEDVAPAGRAAVAEARRAGLPVWLAAEIRSSCGDAARGLFGSQLGVAPLAVHVNPRAEGSVDAASAGGSPSALPGCIQGADGPRLVASGLFERGDAAASDLRAQLVATAATRPGTCLEIGAGRGTKTYVMAAQGRRAGYAREHTALDLHGRKCALNRGRLEAAGLIDGVRLVAGDARDLDGALAGADAPPRLFDTVLVDAPCSGTGTMRRHPEIPWRLDPADARTGLPGLQLAMLEQAAAHVAPGGELFYATCSVLSAENRAVVEAFLSGDRGAGFSPVPVSGSGIFSLPAFAPAAELLRACEDGDGMFQSVPAPGCYDGHFCARLHRSA